MPKQPKYQIVPTAQVGMRTKAAWSYGEQQSPSSSARRQERLYNVPPKVILESLPEFTRQFYSGEKVRYAGLAFEPPKDECDVSCPECEGATLRGADYWLEGNQGRPRTLIHVQRRFVDLPMASGQISVYWSACGKCGYYFWCCPAVAYLQHELWNEIREMNAESRIMMSARDEFHTLQQGQQQRSLIPDLGEQLRLMGENMKKLQGHPNYKRRK